MRAGRCGVSILNDNRNGEPLRTKNPGTLTSGDSQTQRFASGVKLFTDRAYIAAEVPEALRNANFLPIAMNGRKSITCQRAGTVWFLTPTLDRNRDSQSQALPVSPVAGG